MGVDGLDALDAMERSLDAVTGLGERAATRAAPELERVAARQWAAGQAPDGSAWPPTKDGRTPLTSLTEQGSVVASGSSVVVSLPDELLPHQAGSGRLPRRPTLPDEGELPAPWREPFEDALIVEFGDAGDLSTR